MGTRRDDRRIVATGKVPFSGDRMRNSDSKRRTTLKGTSADKPLYVRGREKFATMIASGELAPDTQLPSERDLGEDLGISRMTARQIYKSLEEAGLIYRTDRQGWFVAAPHLEYALGRSVSFMNNIEAKGGRPNSEVLEALRIRPDGPIREKLDLDAAADVYLIRRVMKIGQMPAMIEALYAPVRRFPGLLDNPLDKSLTNLWRTKYNVRIDRSRITLNLHHFSGLEAKMLGLRDGSPGIGISHTYLDGKALPIAVDFQAWRGDIASFDLTVRFE